MLALINNILSECKDNNNLLIEYKPHKQIVKLANRQIKMKY